ncbi:MORN repeat-containing protein 2 [Dunaliella salina]|uniref:MORN repeat-containing protein 2 n=1 Tax=Dunaliella salina TaxID=3046 RepID=A0ABQ7G9X2_DUNSA|nr:MORN repeat-containing protein 2 [Dunaliella salina]|eukprot:KAF5831385.1 MORN repeat-containing protein 2 [Dunaliella salina]
MPPKKAGEKKKDTDSPEEDVITGHGKFTYASGACYDGQWENGVYQGYGKYTWPDGRSYEGEWQQNKMHGNGKYTDANGHKWAGQFYNGAGPGLTYIL